MKTVIMWGQFILVLALSIVILKSCDDEAASDHVKSPNTDGSVETIVSIEHYDNFDVLVSTHKVWAKGFLDKTIVHRDTMPSLGKFWTTDEYGASVELPREYELYITVQ